MARCVQCGQVVFGGIKRGEHGTFCNTACLEKFAKEKGLDFSADVKAQTANMATAIVGILIVFVCGGLWLYNETRPTQAPPSAPALPVNLSGDSTFTVKVSGSCEFSGAISVISADGKSNQRSVDGTAPTEFTETGRVVSVSFQKKEEFGSLGVEILKNGVSVKSSETTAAYGVASVASN